MKFLALASASALAYAVGCGAAYAQDINLTGYTKIFSDEFATSVDVTNASPKTPHKWYYQPPYGASAQFSDSIWDAAGNVAPGDGYLHQKAWLVFTDSTTGKHSYGPTTLVLSDNRHLVTSVTTQGTSRTDTPAWYVGEMGLKFTVGSTAVTATQVGRWVVSGNSKRHRLRIVDAATGADVANGSAILDTSGKTAGQFAYVTLPGTGAALSANHDYYVLSGEGFGDAYLNDDTVVTNNTFATVDTSSYGTWHSGALSSIDQSGAGAKQKYGYFEAKVQMPNSGTGAFTAWWTLSPNNNFNATLGEEVDFFEWYGVNNDPDNVSHACTTPSNHADVSEASHNWNNSVDTTPPAKLSSPCTPMPGSALPTAAFHIYGTQIDPTHITWYIDGTQVNQIATPSAYIASGTAGAFYWMLDYALGGGWDLTGMVNPSEMLVDWVRVWSLPTASAALSSDPSTITSGQASTLAWDGNGTACTGNGFDTAGASSGTTSVSPTATTTYSVTCTDLEGGQATASNTVTVN